VCEHHSFGLHCEQITETVNLAYASSVDGPWTQLLPDGTPFWTGPGETFMRLHWVAVSKALRARRVNRWR
jgi:hypothetical protein